MKHARHVVGLVFISLISSIGTLAWAGPFEPLPAKPPVPADNPMTPAKIKLGKQLFFDPRLSATGTVSCNSCHNVMAGGDDNLSTSTVSKDNAVADPLPRCGTRLSCPSSSGMVARKASKIRPKARSSTRSKWE